MTPQCNVSLTYTKQPLLTQNNPVSIFSSNSNKKKQKCNISKRKIKCVLVGDKAVGKTSLAVSYSNDNFPSEYIPTAYDNYNVDVLVDGEPIRVELCDTAGKDELNPLRKFCYPGTDVFLLCFSLVKPSSFISASKRFAEEIASHEDAAVILIGTQADLKHDPEKLAELRRLHQRPVTTMEAQALAERLNAPYVETSAKTVLHLKEAFDLAITIALKKHMKKRKWWQKLCCVVCP